MGCILAEGCNFYLCIGMGLHVVVVCHLRIQRRIDPSGNQELEGLIEIIYTSDIGTIAFGNLSVCGADRVCGLLTLKILEGFDVIPVGGDDDGCFVVGVGSREFIFAAPFLGDVDTVDDEVVAVRIETCKETVPLTLDKGGLHAEFSRDGIGNLHVIAHKGITLVMVGPGSPGAFHGDHYLTLLLNACKVVSGRFLLLGAGCEQESGN